MVQFIPCGIDHALSKTGRTHYRRPGVRTIVDRAYALSTKIGERALLMEGGRLVVTPRGVIV